MEKLIRNITEEAYRVFDASNIRWQAMGDIGADGMLNITLRTRLEDGTRSSAIRGAEQFQAIIQHFAGRSKGIRGSWTYGDNLDAFNQATVAGLPPEEAALVTWSGKQAAQAGYTRVIILLLSGLPGDYTSVKVNFLRPEEHA